MLERQGRYIETVPMSQFSSISRGMSIKWTMKCMMSRFETSSAAAVAWYRKMFPSTARSKVHIKNTLIEPMHRDKLMCTYLLPRVFTDINKCGSYQKEFDVIKSLSLSLFSVGHKDM